MAAKEMNLTSATLGKLSRLFGKSPAVTQTPMLSYPLISVRKWFVEQFIPTSQQFGINAIAANGQFADIAKDAFYPGSPEIGKVEKKVFGPGGILSSDKAIEAYIVNLFVTAYIAQTRSRPLYYDAGARIEVTAPDVIVDWKIPKMRSGERKAVVTGATDTVVTGDLFGQIAAGDNIPDT